MSRARLIAVMVLAGVAAAGIYHVPSRDHEYVVTGWITGGSPRLAAPGLHWRPPFLARVFRYPAAPFSVDLKLRQGAGPALAGRDGTPVRLAFGGSLRPDPERVLRMHDLLGERFRAPSRLSESLGEALSPTASRYGYDQLLAMDPEPAEAIREAVGRWAWSSGMILEEIRELSFWPEIYADGEPSAAGGRKVLVVGLDGADWRILDPLLEKGVMPNLARIVRNGVRARLRSIAPMLSPIVWTSMATGKRPEKHGIMDFLAVDSRTGRRIPVTSTMRQARAFWGILSGRGIPVGTVGWWATWPAERVLGFQVSDRVAYQLYGPESSGEGLKGRTYPEGLILSLAPEIREGSRRAEEDLRALLGRDPDPANQDEQALRQILISTRTYHHSAVRLLREYAPRVAAVYYEGTDTVAHLFMRYAPPRLPGVPPEDVERWGGVVERYYLLQDRLLGELEEAAGEETVLMVVSDHGFKDGSTRPQTDPRIGVGAAADWHRKYGVLAVSGPGIRKGSTLSDVSVLDVTPTLLALLGLPAAGDMDGRAIRPILEGEGEQPGGVIATYEEEGPEPASAIPDDPAAGAVEQEIIAKLTALGYLGQTTPNASNNVGITLLQQGRHAEAEQAFREAVAKDPGFLPARLNVARALMAGRDLEGALKELHAVRRADPNMSDVENLIGNVLMEQDRVREAEETFRSALTKDARNLHLWNSLGIVLARQGRNEEALAAYRRVVEMDGDYAEAINNIGLIYREQGLFDAAVAEFQRAARADPEFPGSYNNLGLTYQDGGDLGSALEAYDRGLQVDPENPVILNNQGSALLASGRLEEARRSFQEAVDSDPEYASAHNNLGAALGMLGDLEAEFEEYLKAIDLEPDYADARLNLSLNLIRRGRPQEAARALRQVLEREPDHGRALMELGALLIQQGEEDEGSRHLEMARAARPEWPAPRNALARWHLARGRPAEALKEARISLTLDPNQPQIQRLARAAEAAATSGSKP